MTSDFMPIPEIGVKYVKPNGDVIKVTNFYQNNGGVPDYVEYIELSDNSIGEAPVEDWNNLNLTSVGPSGITSVEVLVGKPTSASIDVTVQTTGIKEFAYILDKDYDAIAILNEGEKVHVENTAIASEKIVTIQNLEPNTSHKVYFAFRLPDNEIYNKVEMVEFTTTITDNVGGNNKHNPMDEDDDPYKVKELESLLNNGPSYINPNYFPIDFAKDLPQNEMEETDVEEAFQNTIDEINKKREEGKEKRGGWVNEILWTCAGVDKPLLRMSPTDWAKKAGVGGVILGTGLLATLSGGYAMYTVFDSWWVAVIIGLFWGLLIFNFDRYLVNSMVSDGTAKITKDEFFSALPRIIIAIFLGIVISAPIEIKLFDGNINKVIESDKTNFINTREKEALSNFDAEAQRFKENYENAVNALNVLRSCLKWEESGYYYDRTTGNVLTDDKGNQIKSRQGIGNGDVYKSLKKEETTLIGIVQDHETAYNTHLTSIDKDTIIKDARKEAEEDFKNQVGLIKKYEILQSLTKFYADEPTEEKTWWKFWKREINGLFWVKLVITLLFIILEIMPVFAKMMQEAGWYDKWIYLEDQTMEQLARVKEYNHINVLRTGNLSIYRQQILGHEVIDEDNEGNQAFIKTNTLKQKKDETEVANLEIYSRTIQRHKDYVLSLIDTMYGSVATNTLKQIIISDESKKQDASDDAIKIS